jgi:hypothetical protein
MTPAEQLILVIDTDSDLGQAIIDQLIADEHPAKLALSAPRRDGGQQRTEQSTLTT